MDVQVFKESLLKKRTEILPPGRPLVAGIGSDGGWQGDTADRSVDCNEVHIKLKLKQTDAKILQAIEEALGRLDRGTYGICRDCGEPIAEARLNAIPWAKTCITCKEKQSN